MKKHLLLLFLSFSLVKYSAAQILCVQCFDQNDSIELGSYNLITNGGFESTTCTTGGAFCPNATNYNCSIANWTCTGGGSLTYATIYDSAAFFVEQGRNAVYFGNSYCNPCSGTSASTFPNNDTSCLNHSECTVTGIPAGYPLSGASYGNSTGISISQPVTGLTPGNTYVLEFWAGGEYEGWFSKNGMFAVDVGFGNIFLTCRITQHNVGIGTRYIIEFKAISPSHTIKFTNWGHICGACTELVLDNVKLYTPQYLPPTVIVCTEGINDVLAEQTDVSVYPNPATNQLTVTSTGYEISGIKIYDVLGQLVFQSAITNQQSAVNIESLSKGIYMYEVIGKSGNVKGKVIKD